MYSQYLSDQKNEYPENLNPFTENAKSKEMKKESQNSWNPQKIFSSRLKYTPSSTSVSSLDLTKENDDDVPVEDEKEQPSGSVYRKMSQDSMSVDSKCRTSNSTLGRRKKRSAPPPPVNVEPSLSSSSFTALTIMDLSCRDTIEVETALTITTITTTKNEGNEVDQLSLLSCHSKEEESEK